MREHTVTCRDCGKSVTNISKLKSQIRQELRNEGWNVAIPIWALQSPAVTPERFYADHPELKRKTVDICAPCVQKGIQEGMRRYRRLLNEQEKFAVQ